MIFGYVNTLYRFILLSILSFGLIMVDYRSDMLHPVRSIASVLSEPFYAVTVLPGRLYEMVLSHYPDSTVYDELKGLREENLKLSSKLQTFDALVLENDRLLRLFATSRRSELKMIMAEITNIDLDSYSHRIMINRGAQSGVFKGQPVIVSEGVIGQVSEVGMLQSVVTLITDRTHGIPVQVQRNGLRTIVLGKGELDRVVVPYLLQQADIRRGDVLVTSGMGGRFPAGHKVAKIEEIIIEANESFLTINAVTTSRLNFIKQVLLVWNSTPDSVPN